MSRGTTAVQYNVGVLFNRLVPSFSRVLMLTVGRTLPVTNKQATKDVKYFITDFDLGPITDEFVHSTFFANIILQYIDKFTVRLHGIHIGV